MNCFIGYSLLDFSPSKFSSHFECFYGLVYSWSLKISKTDLGSLFPYLFIELYYFIFTIQWSFQQSNECINRKIIDVEVELLTQTTCSLWIEFLLYLVFKQVFKSTYHIHMNMLYLLDFSLLSIVLHSKDASFCSVGSGDRVTVIFSQTIVLACFTGLLRHFWRKNWIHIIVLKNLFN